MADHSSHDDGANQGDFRRFKKWFQADKEHCAPFHKMAKEDFQFLAGDQWTDAEIATLKSQMRPIITFNRTNPIIQSVSGMEISNRKEAKFFPREEGDAKASEILTEAGKWFRDVCDADDEDSDAFLDATVCGIGVTETTLSFEEDEAGIPEMGSVNPLEVLWDKGARRKNLTDSRRFWRVRKIPMSQAEEMFPGVDKTMLDAKWATLDSDRADMESQEEADRYEGESEQNDKSENDVTIVHLQYKKRVKVRIVQNMETGQTDEIASDRVDTFLKRSEAMGEMYFVVGEKTVTRIRNVFIGSEILGKETEALGKTNFSLQFITAYIDRVTGLPYGLMRMMKDPQKWANKWMSQALHILNTNAKGGVMYEEGSIEDIREFEKNWARNDKAVKVGAGALTSGAIQEKTMANMPSGFFQMMEFAISSVREVTGISLELMGNREATQAASLEFQRRQAGMSLLSPMFDNLKRYRRNHAKLMLHIIQEYLNDGRLIRIVGDTGAQYVPLALDADLQYDIIIDDQVNSPDMKLMIWRLLQPLLPTLPPQIQLALLDYSPLPTTVIEKIKEAAQNIGPSEAEKQAEQLQLAREAAEIEKLKSETAENYAQAQHAGSGEHGSGENSPELDLMKIRQDGALRQADMEMKNFQFGEKLQSDNANKGMDRRQEAALAIVRATMDAETKRMTNNGQKVRN